MVGSTMAALLASNPVSNGLRVLVLDAAKAKPYPFDNSPPDLRVSAVSPRSAAIFQKIGCWDELTTTRHGVYDEMQVWDAFGRGRLHWKATSLGLERLGYIFENRAIQAVVQHRLEELARQPIGASVEFLAPATVKSIDKAADSDDAWPVVVLEGGRTLRARLLVGADGAQSMVKRSLLPSASGFEYNQRAVVATIRTESPTNTAWQRFLPDGPVALLPVNDGYSNIVWSTTSAHARRLCLMSESEFIEALNTAFRAEASEFQPGGRESPFAHVLPEPLRQVLPLLLPDPVPAVPPLAVSSAGVRLSFPLRYQHSERYVTHRTALIGDAAHAIHPMAGQGLNLGLSDASELAERVLEAHSTGHDAGGIVLLEQYERKRMAENTMVMTGIDVIGRLFRPHAGPLALARTVGLDVFNAVPSLKRTSSQVAMGL